MEIVASMCESFCLQSYFVAALAGAQRMGGGHTSISFLEIKAKERVGAGGGGKEVAKHRHLPTCHCEVSPAIWKAFVVHCKPPPIHDPTLHTHTPLMANV